MRWRCASRERRSSEIAADLGLANRGVAHKLVRRGLTRWMHESDEELRALELERTDAIIARLWPAIDCDGPDLKAIDTFLRLADYRARLAGLYAPKRTMVGVGMEVHGEVSHVATLDALRELDAIIEARIAGSDEAQELGDDLRG